MCVPEREKDKLGVKESESFLSFLFLFPFFFSVRGEYYIYINIYFFTKSRTDRDARGGGEDFFPLIYIALLEVLELKREAALLIHADLMIMTAAVDMKPTLTIIKAEKMDGE